MQDRSKDEKSSNKTPYGAENVSQMYRNIFDLWVNTYQSLQNTSVDLISRSSDVWQKMVEDSAEPLAKAANNIIKNGSVFESEQVKLFGDTIRKVGERWKKDLDVYTKDQRSSTATDNTVV